MRGALPALNLIAEADRYRRRAELFSWRLSASYRPLFRRS